MRKISFDDMPSLMSRLLNCGWLLKQAFRCLFSFRASSVVAMVTHYTLKRVPAGVEMEASSVGVTTGPMPVMHAAMQKLADNFNKDILKDAAARGASAEDILSLLNSLSRDMSAAIKDKPKVH